LSSRPLVSPSPLPSPRTDFVLSLGPFDRYGSDLVKFCAGL
jgi:hypothetical protein